VLFREPQPLSSSHHQLRLLPGFRLRSGACN